jgi:hypothetical protein
MPETLKPVPAAFTCEMVAFTPPVFFTVSVWLWLCPTVTLVNVRLVGLAVNVAGVTPVPASARLSGLDPLIVRASVPVTAPAVVGANLIEKVVL